MSLLPSPDCGFTIRHQRLQSENEMSSIGHHLRSDTMIADLAESGHINGLPAPSPSLAYFLCLPDDCRALMIALMMSFDDVTPDADLRFFIIFVYIFACFLSRRPFAALLLLMPAAFMFFRHDAFYFMLMMTPDMMPADTEAAITPLAAAFHMPAIFFCAIEPRLSFAG